MKNSNHMIENRTRDLPTCSAVPQPTVLLRAPKKIIILVHMPSWWAGQRSRYSDWLRAGGSGDRIPVEARFSATVQTGPGAHSASCTMGTEYFPGVKSGRGVTLNPHPPSSAVGHEKVGPLWAVRPVQSLSACTRVHFTLPFQRNIIIIVLYSITVCRHKAVTYWQMNFTKIIKFCIQQMFLFTAFSLLCPV